MFLLNMSHVFIICKISTFEAQWEEKTENFKLIVDTMSRLMF